MNFRGEGWAGLQHTMEEQFNSRQPVELLLGISRELPDHQVSLLDAELRHQGVALLGRVEIGSGPWPVTLRLAVRRPPAVRGTGVLPLAVLLVGALGLVGITGIIGWRVGDVIKGLGDALTKSLVPITLILGGIWLGSKYIEKAR